MREHSRKAAPTGSGRALRGRAAVIDRLENRVLLSAATADIVAGITPADAAQETQLGVFGIVNGKRTSLKVSLDLTHTAAFSLSGGTATVPFQAGTNIDLEVTDISGAILTVTVTRRGSISFGDINVTGNLKTFNATAGVLARTLSVTETSAHGHCRHSRKRKHRWRCERMDRGRSRRHVCGRR